MNDFHFLRPAWFLVLPLLLLLLYRFMRRQLRSRSWQAVCDPQLLPHLLLGRSVRRANWPLWLLLAGLLALVLALAGPVWQRQPQPLFRQQSALVVLFDLSRSMQANDLKPSRFLHARLKIADLLRQRREGQTALIVFAADAFTVTPLTEDRHTIESLLSSLEPELMPAQGSAPARAIALGLELLKQAGTKNGRLLLVTDEDRPARAIDAARQVERSGYILDILGVGTAGGGPILMADGSYFKDGAGNLVLPQLKRDELAGLAGAGGGVYRDIAIDDSDLRGLLDAMETHGLDQAEQESKATGDRWREEAIWLLWPLTFLAAFAFRRGWLLMLTLLLLQPQPVRAAGWADLWQTPDQQAMENFNQKDYVRAAETFSDARWKAAALYRDGQYRKMLKQQVEPTSADDWYNRGNALAKTGAFSEALSAYQRALELDETHADARFNKDLVEQALEQQRSQTQQQNKPSDTENQGERQDKSPKGENASQKEAPPSANTQNKGGEQDSGQKESDPKRAQGKDKGAEAAAAAERDSAQQQAEGAQAMTGDEQEKAAAEQKPETSSELSKETPEQRETRMLLEKIPDDPGGLLRRKFLYQYRERGQQRESDRSW